MINIKIIRENININYDHLFLTGIIIRACRSLLPFQKYSAHGNYYTR